MRLRVQRACPMPLDPAHRGDRFCSSCQKTVVDLSRSTRSEARRILAKRSSDEGVCARVRIGEDGYAVFRPETKRAWAPGLVLASSLVAGGCGTESDEEFAPTTAEHSSPSAGPPMIPLAPEMPAQEPPRAPPSTSPLATSDVTPTSAQRARTRRKHRRVLYPHPTTPYTGPVGPLEGDVVGFP